MDMIGLIPSFGGLLYTVVAFVVALSIIVAVHEYGHYIVGRWSGIQAEVFSLGFGPVVFSRTDRRGTRWQIAALPLGGYVRFLGDADAASGRGDGSDGGADARTERRQTMHGAPLWARAATVLAGPVFNFILSILVFAGFFMVQGVATERPDHRHAGVAAAVGGRVPARATRSWRSTASRPRTTPCFTEVVDGLAPAADRQLPDRARRRRADGRPAPIRSRAIVEMVQPQIGGDGGRAGGRRRDRPRSTASRSARFRSCAMLVGNRAASALDLTVWRDGQDASRSR